MKMTKVLAALLAATMAMGMAACSSTPSAPADAPADKYPARNVNGIVQWSAGGGTDSLMRPLATLAEKELGSKIVVSNVPGGTGSIATEHVLDLDADGYTLLMGAENPCLYKELGIIDATYEDFDCVFLIGDETVGIAVGKDSPYKTVPNIIEAAKAAPESVTIATTGKGGLPWEVASFIKAETGATFAEIPYDSDATAKAAVLNGECDFTVCKVQAGLSAYNSGDLNFLAMFANEKVAQLEEVPLITDEYPEFAEYLPWGPFYGIFVKKGTDKAAIDTLSAAFKKAYEDKSYQDLLTDSNINGLALAGDEAAEYVKNWQAHTVDALKKAGN